MSYEKHRFRAFVGISHGLDAPDPVFSLFPTFERQLAIAETPKTRDLMIFAMTTMITTTTEPIILPLCACTRGNNNHVIMHYSRGIQLALYTVYSNVEKSGISLHCCRVGMRTLIPY